MNQKNRDDIVHDLLAAQTFIGQAQEKAPHLSDLWHVLGKLFDQLDDEQSMVQCREYDDEGTAV